MNCHLLWFVKRVRHFGSGLCCSFTAAFTVGKVYNACRRFLPTVFYGYDICMGLFADSFSFHMYPRGRIYYHLHGSLALAYGGFFRLLLFLLAVASNAPNAWARGHFSPRDSFCQAVPSDSCLVLFVYPFLFSHVPRVYYTF